MILSGKPLLLHMGGGGTRPPYAKAWEIFCARKGILFCELPSIEMTEYPKKKELFSRELLPG